MVEFAKLPAKDLRVIVDLVLEVMFADQMVSEIEFFIIEVQLLYPY